MPEATLSSKYQVTLPMDVVRALGLKGGEKLVVTLVEDHVVLMPKPENWAAWAKGRLKGVYGTTPEEVDRYVRELRSGRSPEEEERREKLEDLLATSPLASPVLHFIKERGAADYSQLLEGPGTAPSGNHFNEFEPNLRNLVHWGAVKELQERGNRVYRLTRLGREMTVEYPLGKGS